ncbi:MAG: hypothetical protein K5639_07575 [Eubacterium sp.]|nr:hypothetical protein [Eubacterium sp.]
MGLNLKSVLAREPITFFINREYGVDIYASTNTGRIAPDSIDEDDDFEYLDIDEVTEYVRAAAVYREHFPASVIEKMIMVTDDINVATKLAFLFAGDDKVHDESDGVFIARFDLHEYEYGKKEFPEFSYELDGAIFYGAENEDDIKKCLNTIMSCDLPYVALIVDEDMWATQTVSRMLFDYPFVMVDARGLTPDHAEYMDMLNAILDDNSDIIKASLHIDISQNEEKQKLANRLWKLIYSIKGDSLRAEDLLDVTEYYIREQIMSNDSVADGDLLDIMGDACVNRRNK